MHSDKSISIIVPAYNEAKHIKVVIHDIYKFLNRNFKDFEIIVVDDGSKDKTAAILDSIVDFPLKVLHSFANRGKGYSIQQGVACAQKDFIFLMDADLSTPLEEMNKLLRYMDQGYDIVIGSRALPDSRIIVKQELRRRLMGKIFNMLVRLMLLRDFRDTQCGFKCFKKEAAKNLFGRQRINRFCFDVEILYMAKISGLKIKETGISWLNRSDSRVAVWKDSCNMLGDLFRIKKNRWRGLYEVNRS